MVAARGTLTISIDLELAWGVWDKLTNDDLRLAETLERSICAELIGLFDRYDVPATWATVAALLDANSAMNRPGKESCWYAPDIIEQLFRAKAAHEFASHSGHHIYFDQASKAEAADDIAFAAGIHRAQSLPLRSFVFPRNAVGHLDVLADAGIKTYRGPDVSWTTSARKLGRTVGRAANFADKFLPVPPQPVQAAANGALVDIPGSMLLLGRNALRRMVLPQVTRAKLAAGLSRAQASGGIFHFWFHPSNFYFRREEQFATLAWFLKRARGEESRGRLDIRTMGSYAVQ